MNAGKEIYHEETFLSPIDIYKKRIEERIEHLSDLKVSVYSEDKLLVEYQPKEEEIPELAKPAEAAKRPEEIMTNEELLLTAQHIEQHRHAAYLPDPYYLEGLKRDPYDSRINNAYGMLLFRRGNFAEAERHLIKILEKESNEVFYSVASVWEVAIKHKIKPENMPISEEFVELCENTGFIRLPIEPDHIFMLKTLARFEDAPKHNDPFDRMLLAQAKYEDLNLITHDPQFLYYGENCVMNV